MRFQIFNHPQRSVTCLTWRLERRFCELGSRWDWLSKWLASRRNPSTFCLQWWPFGGSCLLRQNGKRNDCGSRHWLELVRKRWYFFFLRLFQLVYFQWNWAGYSEAAVFTQCHCFLKGCPLPKSPSLCWEGSWPLSHPAAITWLASTSLLLGHHFQGFMFWWLTHWREGYEMHK